MERDSPEFLQSVQKSWGLTPFKTLTESPWAALQQALAEKIQDLLDNDHRALMNAFYRLDVDAEKADLIIKKSKIDRVAWDLAELVLNREYQKALTRKAYQT